MSSAAGETVVVVGNGMASHALCQELARVPREQRPRVVVLGDEPRPAYNRVRLSEVMTQSVPPEALELAPRSWYEAQGIELHTGDRVARIDRDGKRVCTEAGRQLAYDRLVLATGSEAFRPPIPGIDHPACFVYRSLEDLDALSRAIEGAERAAVIGGGLLGLEAAGVLQGRGLRVTVIESAAGLMPRQLDADSGACLQRHVEQLGVEVRVGELVTELRPGELCVLLELKSGERVAADLVVVAAGIRARDELAAEAGLTCNLRGGVVVDDALSTSDPSVYAIGECVSHHGHTYGLARPCLEMGRVLAKRLLGETATFPRPDLSCQLKLLGVDVFALGDYGNEHRALAVDVPGGRRTLLLEDDVLVGAVAVGPWQEMPRIEQAIAEGETLTVRAQRRFAKTGLVFGERAALPVIEWPDQAMVCNCAQVRAGELRAQIRAGACDVSTLAARTGVTTGCGSCRPLLGSLLGDAALAATRTRTFGLGWLSVAALVAALLTLLLAPLDFATSVSDAWRAVDRLWREREWKQITGFTTVGIVALGLLLTLRKRARWFKLGDFNLYRAVHALLGTLTLATLLAHTGLRLGERFNLLLMTCFLGASLLGALAGVTSSVESKASGAPAVRARRARPSMTLLHIVLVWPLPVLIGLHVLAVYYF